MRYSQLRAVLAETGGAVMCYVMNHLPQLREQARPQGSEGACHAPKVHRDAARVVPAEDTISNAYNKLRALDHIWVMIQNRRVRFSGAVPEHFSVEDMNLPPGTVRCHSGVLQLRVRNGWVAFSHAQRESGRLLNVTEFVNGFMRSTSATLQAS